MVSGAFRISGYVKSEGDMRFLALFDERFSAP